MVKILVVEDDKELNATVCKYLSLNGYEAVGCLNAIDAYDEMYGASFDMIISDIMMPKIDGFEFAETVRGLNKNIPILFMTAKDDMRSMRRANISANKSLTVGRLTMNEDEQSCVYDGEEIALTVREFNLLYKLLSNPKKTFTRSQLMNEFWDIEATSGLRSVDVYMRKLREKFGSCDEFEIVTVHGLGYKAVLK